MQASGVDCKLIYPASPYRLPAPPPARPQADTLPPTKQQIQQIIYSNCEIRYFAEDAAEHDKLVEQFTRLKSEYDIRHAFWTKQNLDSELANALLVLAHEPALAFYDAAQKELIPALRTGNRAAALAAMAKMKQAYDRHLLAINRVVALSTQRAEATENRSNERIADATTLLLSILAISLGTAPAGGRRQAGATAQRQRQLPHSRRHIGAAA